MTGFLSGILGSFVFSVVVRWRAQDEAHGLGQRQALTLVPFSPNRGLGLRELADDFLAVNFAKKDSDYGATKHVLVVNPGLSSIRYPRSPSITCFPKLLRLSRLSFILFLFILKSRALKWLIDSHWHVGVI